MLIKVFSVLSMPSKLPPGVCWRGGGGGGGGNRLAKQRRGGAATARLPGLVTKHQAVEFPQVLASEFGPQLGCLHGSPRQHTFKGYEHLHRQ